MAAWARTAGRLTVIFLAVFALAGIALFLIAQSVKFRDWIQAELSQRSGFEIRVAHLRFRLPFNVVAEKVEVSKPGELFFTAATVAATFSPFAVLSRTLDRVEIETSVLQIDMPAMLKTPRETSQGLALRHLNVKDGRILLKRGEATLLELPNVNLTADNVNLGVQSGINLRADVPPLSGEAELRMTGQPRNLETELIVRPKQNQSFFAGQRQKDVFPELLHVRAKLQVPENQKADAIIEGKFQNLAIGESKFTGDLDARAEIDSGWTAVSFTGRAALMDLFEAIGPAFPKLSSNRAMASFTGSFLLPKKTLSLKSVELTSDFANGAAQGEMTFEAAPAISKGKVNLREISLEDLKNFLPAPFEAWTYQGRIQLELEIQGPFDALAVKGLARGDALRIHSEGLDIANLTIAAPFEWVKHDLRIREGKLTSAKIGFGGKNRWQSNAEKFHMTASAEIQPGAAMKLSGRLEASGGKFASPDNTKVGENLTFRGPFELAWSPTKRLAMVKTGLTAEGGEILWGKFFGDLKSRRLALNLDGDYDAEQNRIECRRCSADLGKVGGVEFAGSIERLDQTPVLRARARSTNFSPGAFFDFLLRENFKREYPLLEKLDLGGQLAFHCDLTGALDALVTEGELSLKSGELRLDGKDWKIAPIALDLPFRIHLAGVPEASDNSVRAGTLSIGSARFGKQSAGPLTATISLSDNSLRFHQAIRLNLFGGQVEIANLFWPDLVHDPKRAAFSADVSGLQLENLTEALNWHRFSGTLSGSIPQVESSGALLRTSGEIQAELFGGRMRIGKLEIENPFSPLASVKLNAKLNDIQMEKLSSTFEFGRISGILEGSIEDLVLTAGEPSELRAEFHSVEQAGAEQRISVEAINKITVLSSGQNASALYGGLAGFIDSFRYSKLGFKATLKNDTLSLRGVETRGDQEFLVVGSLLPPTVNIISHTQNIAFSELLRRLERIKSDGSNVK